MASIRTEDRTATVAAERRPRRPRPHSEYWDFRTATWQVASPIPAPRRGD